MTCKQCIHYKPCNAEGNDIFGNDFANVVESVCEQFDDKSRYAKIPCKIGDTVWAIQRVDGIEKVIEGKVSEIYFIEGMRLCIVVKNVVRGEWGKNVFSSREEALKAIEEAKR